MNEYPSKFDAWLYSKTGEVIYKETKFKNFSFNTFLLRALKGGIHRDRIDFDKTIEQLNAYGDLNIKRICIEGDNRYLNRIIAKRIMRLGHHVDMHGIHPIRGSQYDMFIFNGLVEIFDLRLDLENGCDIEDIMVNANINLD